jgi:hypothetical protein
MPVDRASEKIMQKLFGSRRGGFGRHFQSLQELLGLLVEWIVGKGAHKRVQFRRCILLPTVLQIKVHQLQAGLRHRGI